MEDDPRRLTATVPNLRRRLRAAQIDAMFSYIAMAAVGAALAAAALAFGLVYTGFADVWIAVLWAGAIQIIAVANLVLSNRYWRRDPASERRLGWLYAYLAINFLSGVAFGLGPIVLRGASSETQLSSLLVILCVVSGSIVALSPYLPGFLAFFLPATVPFTIACFYSPYPFIRPLGPVLMAIYIMGTGALGWRANRTFAALVETQLRVQALADDLTRQKDLAEQANRAKSAFLAAASHDLRQPVHALGLFVSALRGIETPREAGRLIDRIGESIEALDALFNAILDLSRLDAGVVEVRRRRFAIGPLIERVASEFAREAELKGLRLRTVRSGAAIDSDPTLVERILRNFVSNAIRYATRGGVLIGCRLKGDGVALQVWDTGIGIPDAEQAKVFDEYYQAGNPERDRTRGLGLGLAIVRRLCGLLDAQLAMRSVAGRGSCFEVVLPAARAPVAAEDAPADAAPAGAPGRLILVVDDDPAIRDAMAALLRNWGHAAVTAESGEDALAQLARSARRPDLMICDYRLRSEENGIETIERLRVEYNETIPAILITGDTAPERLAEARASGLPLLQKPVAPGKLRAAVVRLTAGADEGCAAAPPETATLHQA